MRKLNNFIMADDARWTMAEVNEGVFSVWQVTIDSFHCDRILKKKDEYNLKTQEQMALATEDEKKKKTFTLLYREFVSIEKGHSPDTKGTMCRMNRDVA